MSVVSRVTVDNTEGSHLLFLGDVVRQEFRRVEDLDGGLVFQDVALRTTQGRQDLILDLLQLSVVVGTHDDQCLPLLF